MGHQTGLVRLAIVDAVKTGLYESRSTQMLVFMNPNGVISKQNFVTNVCLIM